MRVLQVSRGLPFTSAEHEPHFAALQFQRTARSGAMWPEYSAARRAPPFPAPLAPCTRPACRPCCLRGRHLESRPPSFSLTATLSSARICFNSCGHGGNGLLRQRHVPRCFDDDVVLRAPFRIGSGKSMRLCAPRLSSRASALRATASEIVSIDFRSSARCQPGLNMREPSTLRVRPALLQFSSSASAFCRSFRVRKIPTRLCIVVLQIAMNGIGILAALPLKRRQRFAFAVIDLRLIDRRRRDLLGVLARPPSPRGGQTRADPKANCRPADSRRADPPPLRQPRKVPAT